MMKGNRAFIMLILFPLLFVIFSSTSVFSQTPRDRLKAEATEPIYTTLESPPSYIWDCIIARMLIDLQGK